MVKKYVIASMLAAAILPATASALEVGDTAPCVVLENIEPSGDSTEACIRDHQDGQEFTIVEFFSVFCGACTRNLPTVSALADMVEENTQTRLVAIDRSRFDVQDYLDDHQDLIHFPVALDVDRDAKRAYDVIYTPTLFVLDANQKVVYKHVGMLTRSDVIDILSITGNL